MYIDTTTKKQYNINLHINMIYTIQTILKYQAVSKKHKFVLDVPTQLPLGS